MKVFPSRSREAVALVASAICVFVSTPVPASAAGISRADAARKAIAALGARQGDDAVTVFALRAPVRAGTEITQAGPSGTPVAARAAQVPNARLTRAGVRVIASGRVATARRASWLFYADQGPHQAFEHPGRIVLVTRGTGRVTVSAPLRWVPLVGGRLPAFFRSPASYQSSRYRVFDRPWKEQAKAASVKARAAAVSAEARAAQQRLADALAAERSCALRVSDTLGDFYDFERVDKTRAALGRLLRGLSELNPGFVTRRYVPGPGQSPAEAAQGLIDGGCRDLFLYVAGSATRTGEAGVVVGLRAAGSGAVAWHTLPADAIEQLVKANPKVTFKLLFDAPYAGRIADRLSDERNVSVLLTAGARDEPSFSYLPQIVGPAGLRRNTSNPFGLLEFTNAVIEGIGRFVTTPAEIDTAIAEQAGGRTDSVLAWMLARSLRLGPSPLSAVLLPPTEQRVPPTIPPAPVNHTPVATTPGQLTAEDTPRDVTLTAFDVDRDPLTFTVTVPPAHGTLAGTAPFLRYTPDRDFFGVDQLTYQVSDGRGGTATATVFITVTPDNDLPAIVFGPSSTPPAFTENGAPVTVDGGLQVIDIDDARLAGARVEIAAGRVAGDVLAFTPSAGITGSFDAPSGVLTLTGAASVTAYRDVLRSVRFSSTSDDPGTARTIRLRADDAGENGVTAARQVTVVPVNDAPAVTAPAARSVDEDGTLTFAGDLSVDDADAAPDDVSVRLTAGHGVLALATTAGLTSSAGDGTGDVTAVGSPAEVAAALDGLTYRPAADRAGPDTLTVEASDLGHEPGPAATDTATVAVTVDAVNDAPVNTVPAAQTIAEDGDVTLTGAFAVADADAGAGTVATELALPGGEITVGAGAGTVSGDGTAAVRVEGTLAEVNARLQSVTVAGAPDVAGARTLTMTTDDGGNTGAGGARSDADTVAFTLTAVNDAPVVTRPAGTQTIDEDTPLTFTAGGAAELSVADVDAGASAVEVTVAALRGTLSAGLAGPGLTVTGEATDTVTLTGPLAAVNDALDGLAYAPAQDEDGDDTLTVVADDQGATGTGGALTDTEAIAVAITPVADGPALTQPDAALAYAEDDPSEDHAAAIAPGLTAADVDSTGAQSATVTIGAGFSAGEDVLSYGGSLLTATVNGTGDTLTLSGAASIAAYQAELRKVRYANTSDAPSTAARTVAFALTDAEGVTGPAATRAVAVSATNDAPAVATSAGAATFTEDDADGEPVDPALGLADPDDTSLAGATVQIAAGRDAATDALLFTAQSGIAVDSWTPATGTLVLTGAASVADYRAALRTVRLRVSGDTPGTATRTVTVAATDGDATGAAVARDVAVAAVNDAPVLALPGGQSVVENATLALDGADAIAVSDPDAGSDDLRVTLTADHGTLTLAGTTGLAFTAGDGTSDATMTFAGTAGALSTALDGLVYTPTTGWSGAETLSVSVSDLGHHPAPAQTDAGAVAIDVLALNRAPVNGVPGAQNVDEDTALTFTDGGGNALTVADADAGADDLRVALAVDHGALTLAGTTGLSFTAGDGTDDATMTFDGSLTEIADALDGLRYEPAADFSGADTLTVTTDDLGHTGQGGAQRDTDAVAIAVAARNDAPVATVPSAQTLAEEGTLTFGAGARLAVADVDAGAADVTVDLTATHGTVTLGATAGLVVGGDGTAHVTATGTLSAVNAGLLGTTFTAEADHAGAAQLTLAADDGGHTGAGGAQTDSEDVAITVTGVNDAPVAQAQDATVSVNQGGTLTFRTADGTALSVADVDAGAADVEVALAVAHGTLTLARTTGLTFTAGADASAAMTFTGTVADAAAALAGLEYRPTPGWFGSDTLDLSIDDLGHSGAGGAASDALAVDITVLEANSPPVNAVPAAQTFDEDTTRTFSAAGLNGIAVDDENVAAPGELEVALGAGHGTLTLATTTGLAASAGDGTGAVTLRGTPAAVNAALDGLVYAPAADWNGDDALTVTTDDLGQSGPPGALTDTDTVTLHVTAVNDAPVLTVPGARTVAEDGTVTLAGGAAIAVADVDAATARVTLAATNGRVTLARTTGLSFTAGDGTDDATVTFTGTPANVGAALDGLVFAPTADHTGAAAIAVTASDLGSTGSGGAQTDSETVAITVTAVNDAPVATAPAAVTTAEDTPRTFAGTIAVADADAGSGAVEVTLAATHGTLTLAGTTDLSFTTGDGTGDTTATFTGTVGAVDTALDGLAYAPAANYAGAAQITLDVSDQGNTGAGGALTDSATTAVTVTAVNDAPVLGVPGGQTVAEDTALVLSGGSAPTVADADAGGADLRLALAVDHGTLTLGATTGLSVVSGADGTGAVTVDGTVAELGAALAGLRYTGQSNYHGADTLSLALDDRGNSGGAAETDTASVGITVTPVNDAPVADDDAIGGADAAVGNTTLVVDGPGAGTPAVAHARKTVTGDILDGDDDVDGPGPLTVIAGTFATDDGGSVVLEADGDFTFHPSAATSCTDHQDAFTYTVDDNDPTTPQTDTGRVTIATAGCVWYVDNAAAGNAGTAAAPFDTLAQAETASGAGDTTFVLEGDGGTTGYATGYALAANERLIGEEAGLTVGSDTLKAPAPGARPTLTATNEDVLDLAAGNEVRGLDVDPQGTGGGIFAGAGDAGGTIDGVTIADTGTLGTEPGLEMAASSGTWTITDLTVSTSGATATGIKLTNAGTIDFDTTDVTTAGGRALDASGATTNLATSRFGAITVTGSAVGAVRLSNTTGAVALGDGTSTDLDLQVTGGATQPLFVNNAGTVTVDAAGTDTIASTGVGAVIVDTTSGSTFELDTVTATNPVGNGIQLSSTGTSTFAFGAGSSITGATGTAFDVSGGSGTITWPGTINDGDGTYAVSVLNRTGGTATFSGAINDDADTGGGVRATGNTGGTIAFSHGTKTFNTGTATAVDVSNNGATVNLTGGGLNIDTTTGKGLVATTGGVLTVTGAGNTIDTGAGRALEVTGTNVGATPLTFERISANGASSGILLSNTGSASALTVTSTGSGTCTTANTSGCTGGAILNATGGDDATTTPAGTAIALNNVRGVSLTRMRLANSANYGIRGTSVTGLTLASSVIDGTNGTNATTTYRDGAARFSELTGTVTVTSTEVSGGYSSNWLVNNTAGTLDATFTAFRSGTLDATGGDDAVQIEGLGAATVNATFLGSTFTTATGDLLQYVGNGTGGGTLALTNSTLSNNEPSIATGGGGVTLSGGAAGPTTINVSGSSFRDAKTSAITIAKSRDGVHTGTLTGSVTNNTIGVAGVDGSGSLEGAGISATHFGSGNATLTVANNQIRQYNTTGLRFIAGAGIAESGQLNLAISGNTILEPGSNPAVTLLQGLRVESGVTSGDAFQTCVDLGANTMHPSGDPALSGGASDYRLIPAYNSTIKLPGYAGGSTDTNAVVAFANARIGGGATGTAAVLAPGQFLGGSSCP